MGRGEVAMTNMTFDDARVALFAKFDARVAELREILSAPDVREVGSATERVVYKLAAIRGAVDAIASLKHLQIAAVGR